MRQYNPGEIWSRLRGQNFLPAAFLLLPVAALLPILGGIPYPSPTAEYSDFAISHYPNAVYLQRMLFKGIVPLWSPLILSGYPFFASPLSGLWYPPGWLALMLPLPFGMNLVVLLHLCLAGAGQYRLARWHGLAPLPAALAGMAFAGLPKLTAHLGAGHISLIYAVSWTPWLLLSARSRKWAGSGAALILAAITLADPRWLPYAAGAWFWHDFYIRSREEPALQQIKRLGLQIITAMLLAAPLLAPLWEYTRHSSRAAMTASDVLEYSLPWDRLLGLVYPQPGGFHEWVLYPGAVVLLLGLSALLVVREGEAARRVRAWGGLILVCLLWALGEHIPGLAQIARLPVLSWLRVPARSLFLAGMGLGMMAAHGLQTIIEGAEINLLPRLRLLIFAMLVGVGGVGLGALVLSGKMLPPFTWGMVGITAAGLILLTGISRRPPPPWWTQALLLIAAFDLLFFGRTLIDVRPAGVVLFERFGLAQVLVNLETAPRGASRVYSPSYSLPQQTASRYEVELADGVEPLQWQPYVRYMEAATGVPASAYSVTLPAFASGEPATANRNFAPDAELLGWLNVRYISSEFDLQIDGLELIENLGSTRLYQNQYARPRAWVQPSAGSSVNEIQPVNDLVWKPNQVDILAEGEGLLVLSELAYPGWQVSLDGKEVPLLTIKGILRAVEIPPGEHRVNFVFRPKSLIVGLALFLAGLILLAGNHLLARRHP